MALVTHQQSEIPEEEQRTFESILLRHIAEYRSAVAEGNHKAREQQLKAIHDMLNAVSGEDYAEMLVTFRAIVDLQDYALTVAAIAAIGNLDSGAASAVPVILREGLKGDQELVKVASYALESIRTPEALLALVELLTGCENYLALVESTLPSLTSFGSEAQPFMVHIEEALNRTCPNGVEPKHPDIMSRFWLEMRDLRLDENALLDLPGAVCIDMLHNDRHRRVDDLEQLHESEFPVAQGEIFYDRLSFSLHGQRSEVGLAIYALSQTPCGHLVVFEQDGTSYGEDVQSLIEPLAAVVAARYRLHPDTTRWASLTTRESGLLTRDRETYALYTLVHDPTCERYTNTCMETFYCLHDVFRALHRH